MFDIHERILFCPLLMSGFEPNHNYIDLVRFPVPVQKETSPSLLQLGLRPRSRCDRQTYEYVKGSSRISRNFIMYVQESRTVSQ
jgi:hypothetical protein